MNRTRLLSTMAVFVAIGIIGSQFLWFPAGFAKAYPVQHAVNVVAGVLLGPGPAVLIAIVIGLIRNMLGLGSILAFPGGMIGAFLAGVLYQRWRKPQLAVLGEVIGTGILASFVSIPLAKLFMGTSFGIFFFLPSFLVSSVSGALLGWFVLARVRQSRRMVQFAEDK